MEKVIVTTDNTTHPVVKEGIVKINVGNIEVQLSDVYHVPALKKYRISVSQITSLGKYVLFGPNSVKILNDVRNIDADIIFKGKRKDFLFVLSAGEAYVKRTSQVDSPTLWHARLGHVGYQMLQIIASNKLIDGLPKLKQVKEDVVCQGCQFGKAYKLPFKSSN